MNENDTHVGATRHGKKVPPPVPKKKLVYKTASSPVPSRDTMERSSSPLDVSREELLQCDDLTRLPLLYSDTVLECILERYSEDVFYTWAGPTLVAINPCRPMDHLYSPIQMKSHFDEVQVKIINKQWQNEQWQRSTGKRPISHTNCHCHISEHHHLHIPTSSVTTKYSDIKPGWKNGVDRRDAHVFSVAGLAHHRLTHHLGKINQAVLVSGESGAGKTESARYMLGYLTSVEVQFPLSGSPMKGVWQNRQPKDIQERILSSNPILEAFGNAATLRNHNSSRFGKLIRLQYGGCQLRGAEIDTYLLEKTRVTCQPENERNFHIFYQLLAVMRTKKVEGLHIKEDDHFAIAPGEILPNDLSNFENTLLAFQHLGFTIDHQMKIFKIVSAVLHLGNISFSESSVSNQTAWTVNKNDEESLRSLVAACDLLGIKEEELIKTLTVHTINVGTARKVNVFHKPCERQEQCVERLLALMQLLYHSLFLHIAAFINKQVSAERSHWSNFLGILDVYGFETFTRNSLEQLCINYANERLQQEFIKRYLASEHQVLKEEGFLGMDIMYTDNTRCVLALDSPVSVFTILNEECQLKRAVKEDETCDRVCKALVDTGVVSSPVSRDTPGFIIRHYAGPVKYDADGLLLKNKDEVPHEVTGLLAASGEDFVGKLMTHTEDVNFDTGTGRRRTRKITTLSKFKASLDTLMKTLSECDLHYVRCLKPNAYSLKGDPDRQYLLDQLMACGVIETVTISQAGYPVRISYDDFVKRYGQPGSDKAISAESIAKAVLGSSDGSIDVSVCRFGRTRMFISESALNTLEKVRWQKQSDAAVCLQKYWRKYQCVRRYKAIRSALMIVQRNAKAWVAKQRFKRLKSACIFIQKNVRKLILNRKYLRTCNATIVLQKYFRGWTARKKYEVLIQQNMTRPFSRQSVISMNSLGYFSLTNSNSVYSLNPSLPDMSPTGASFSSLGIASMNNEELKASLEHQKRLLETEESGIETDTESLDGDVKKSRKRKSRRVRRRARLQGLLESQDGSEFPQTASEESLDTSASNSISQSSRVVGSGHLHDSTDKGRNKGSEVGSSFYMNASGASTVSCDKKHSQNEKVGKIKPIENDTFTKIRVATMHNFQELPELMKEYPCESLQMVLPKQNLSLFFKDGVLSYRRMPTVGIKFHTRPTCLPYSHHLPHQEQPHGLLDVLS